MSIAKTLNLQDLLSINYRMYLFLSVLLFFNFSSSANAENIADYHAFATSSTLSGEIRTSLEVDNFQRDTIKVLKPKEFVANWYHIGFLKQNSDFHKQAHWDNVRPKNWKYNPSLSLQRLDVFLKTSINEDYTFSEQYYDTKRNKPRDKKRFGSWKIDQDTLKLSYEIDANGIVLKRHFLVDAHDEMLDLKIIKETNQKDGIITISYDFFDQQRKLEKLIKFIGISSDDFIAENGTKGRDFWRLLNFGKYQVLYRTGVRFELDDQIPEEFQDAFAGKIWGYVPFYHPIFEQTSEMIYFNKNDELVIRYQDLLSQSGDCGTLSDDDYYTTWNFNKAENLITINHKEEELPFEICKLFFSENPKSENYTILAKNDFMMIWQN